ncbi:hypothetical protein AAFP35_16845 [Gordonia sp. CPCC 206044]|uniref:hypothetical protein n=1 Tax=Gordonia sp. CPCC 206044 TaxID=3140793 RepID=UPI003AF3A3EA
MGQPTGQQPRPPVDPPSGPPADDLYRTPLHPQLYPPLGYGPDGTPIFVPGQKAPVAGPAAGAGADGGPPRAPEEAAGLPEPDGRRRREQASDRRLVGVLALVAVAALGLLALTVGRAALRDDESTTATEPTLPMVIPEAPTGLPTAPGQEPGGGSDEIPGVVPNDPASPAGKEVVYQVTASTATTILYVDAEGLRTTVGAPSPWTVSFTANANPLRILVLAGRGAASCEIKVDGQTIASDQITETSTRRTVSCRG